MELQQFHHTEYYVGRVILDELVMVMVVVMMVVVDAAAIVGRVELKYKQYRMGQLR